jgi:hypothetical protein
MAATGAVIVTAAGVGGVAHAMSLAGEAATTGTTASVTAVDAALAKDLQFTREEERMARDLYAALAAKHGDAMPFSRITRSEQRHFDAVGNVLTRYGVSDPSAGKAAGTYAYAELQKLYDDWLAQGGTSLEDAYDVGVALEKRDIADLEALEAKTTEDAAKALFTSLREASEHHLAAFDAWAAGDVPGNGQMGPGNGPGNGQGRMGNGDGMGRMGNGDGVRRMGSGMGPGSGTGDCPYVDQG